MKDVLDNPNKPWDWDELSYHLNMSMSFIEKHISKINFQKLSFNKFNVDKIIKVLNKKKRNIVKETSIFKDTVYRKRSNNKWLSTKKVPHYKQGLNKIPLPDELSLKIQEYL